MAGSPRSGPAPCRSGRRGGGAVVAGPDGAKEAGETVAEPDRIDRAGGLALASAADEPLVLGEAEVLRHAHLRQLVHRFGVVHRSLPRGVHALIGPGASWPARRPGPSGLHPV